MLTGKLRQMQRGVGRVHVDVLVDLVRVLLLLLQVHDGTYTPADQFVKDPDSLCSTVTWKDEEDRVIWVYRIQVRLMCTHFSTGYWLWSAIVLCGVVTCFAVNQRRMRRTGSCGGTASRRGS
jgi:hypothetical protein